MELMILWYYKSIICYSRTSLSNFNSTPLLYIIVSPFTLANPRVNFSCNIEFCTLLFQSAVGTHFSLEMVLLRHIKAQLWEQRSSSDVTLGLSQLRG